MQGKSQPSEQKKKLQSQTGCPMEHGPLSRRLKVSSNFVFSPHLDSTYCATCTAAWPSQSQSSCVQLHKPVEKCKACAKLWGPAGTCVYAYYLIALGLPIDFQEGLQVLHESQQVACILPCSMQPLNTSKKEKMKPQNKYAGMFVFFVCQTDCNIVHKIQCSLTFQCSGAVFPTAVS